MVRALSSSLIFMALAVPLVTGVGSHLVQSTEPTTDLVVSLLNFGAVGVAAYLFWRAWQEERSHSRAMECKMLDALVQQAESNFRLADAIDGVVERRGS